MSDTGCDCTSASAWQCVSDRYQCGLYDDAAWIDAGCPQFCDCACHTGDDEAGPVAEP